MLGFLKGFLALFNTLASYFANKQLIDAGKAEQTVTEVAKVEEHVQKAENAVRTPDAVRDDRLRNKFDRSRGGGSK